MALQFLSAITGTTEIKTVSQIAEILDLSNFHLAHPKAAVSKEMLKSRPGGKISAFSTHYLLEDEQFCHW